MINYIEERIHIIAAVVLFSVFVAITVIFYFVMSTVFAENLAFYTLACGICTAFTCVEAWYAVVYGSFFNPFRRS